jgi:hypothetical protein
MICSKPDATLRYEALLNTFYGKNILRQYVMPLAEILFVAGFVRLLLFGNQEISSAVVKSIFDYLSFIASYGVLFYLVRLVSRLLFKLQFEDRNISMMVVSLMSVPFVVKLFLSLMPNMFFVNFFYVYVLYLVWVMSEGVVDVPEGQRNKYMVEISLLIIIIPLLIALFMKRMVVPNL